MCDITDPPAEQPYQPPFAPISLGIVVGQGIRNVERLLALLETAGDQRLPALAAEMLGNLAAQLRCVAEQVKEVEVKLLAWHRADETSRTPCHRFLTATLLKSVTAQALAITIAIPIAPPPEA